MPDALLQWMEGRDTFAIPSSAQSVHAVNVQMLRAAWPGPAAGQSSGAAISGQMETVSPSNLLRLRLPLPMGELEQGMDVLCVLLRFSELEFDSHRLRRCRRRLRDQQRELITMVRQQRHWERRCLDHDAAWQNSLDPNTLNPGG